MSDSADTQLSCLSVTDLSQVFAHLHSARALAVVACTSKLFRAAAALAFRELCISTGKSTNYRVTSGATGKCIPQSNAPKQKSFRDDQNAQQRCPTDWRSMYFQQSYALSFNGVNDYIQLPCGLLRHLDGLTIDMMVLAHPIASNMAQDRTGIPPKCVMPPAGGMLFGCQDREFGRSRRAARLYTLPLLYVGTDGFLRSAVGRLRSKVPLADGQWHRVTLTMSLSEDHSTTLAGVACLFVDGCLDDVTRQWDFPGFPSYPVLGSGITEGHMCGASTPVYNCHTFHGLIDELRMWERPLTTFEVQYLGRQRIASLHDMPYARLMVGSWSLTEGRGLVMHNHIKKQNKAKPGTLICTKAHLGAVPIPSAHHTYGSVSNLVNEIPDHVRYSCGPQWVHSDAPVEGQLIMEYLSSSVD